MRCYIEFGVQRFLKVYLAPILHGARYTSFGRHFTANEKLEKVAWQLVHKRGALPILFPHFGL